MLTFSDQNHKAQVEQFNDVEIMFENDIRKPIAHQTIPNSEGNHPKMLSYEHGSALSKSQNL